MVIPTNSSSEEMFIELGCVYSVITILCNFFLIVVILSKAELRGQVDFFLSMTKDKHWSVYLHVKMKT